MEEGGRSMGREMKGKRYGRRGLLEVRDAWDENGARERKERSMEQAKEKKDQERNEEEASKEKKISRDLFGVCWRQDMEI